MAAGDRVDEMMGLELLNRSTMAKLGLSGPWLGRSPAQGSAKSRGLVPT